MKKGMMVAMVTIIVLFSLFTAPFYILPLTFIFLTGCATSDRQIDAK
jgi:hypothetical protein